MSVSSGLTAAQAFLGTSAGGTLFISLFSVPAKCEKPPYIIGQPAPSALDIECTAALGTPVYNINPVAAWLITFLVALFFGELAALFASGTKND